MKNWNGSDPHYTKTVAALRVPKPSNEAAVSQYVEDQRRGRVADCSKPRRPKREPVHVNEFINCIYADLSGARELLANFNVTGRKVVNDWPDYSDEDVKATLRAAAEEMVEEAEWHMKNHMAEVRRVAERLKESLAEDFDVVHG